MWENNTNKDKFEMIIDISPAGISMYRIDRKISTLINMVFRILILTTKKKKPEPAAASCVSIKRTVVKWIILQFN